VTSTASPKSFETGVRKITASRGITGGERGEDTIRPYRGGPRSKQIETQEGVTWQGGKVKIGPIGPEKFCGAMDRKARQPAFTNKALRGIAFVLVAVSGGEGRVVE